jgi:Fe-S oxidoreductase
MSEVVLNIRTMADYLAKGEMPEYLFWVGCAGSFDDRQKKVTRAFCEILQKAKISYAILIACPECHKETFKKQV